MMFFYSKNHGDNKKIYVTTDTNFSQVINEYQIVVDAYF